MLSPSLSHLLITVWTGKVKSFIENIDPMMTSSNGNIFRVTGPLCGEFTGPGEFPAQRPMTRSFDVFFDLRLNKRLSKQPWGWWFETPAWSLWRHRNAFYTMYTVNISLLMTYHHKKPCHQRSCTAIVQRKILCMGPANGRRSYNVTSSLIGWAHTQNDPCSSSEILRIQI